MLVVKERQRETNGAFVMGERIMKKEITIGTVTFPVQSSAFTPFAYRNMTGRELLKDLMDLQSKLEAVSEDETKSADVISGVLNDVLQLAYVMHQEAEPSAKPFNEWLKQFDGILDDNTWLAEVVATAAATFRRKVETD